jgi:uncharacterized protein involved in outer membrane biogenesis
VPRWSIILAGLGVVVLAAVLLFRWDWLIPLVQAQASAALHRPVRIGHLEVSLGRVTTVTASDVTVADPDGFPADQHFAQLGQLAVSVDVRAFLHDRSVLRIPLVSVVDPDIVVATNAAGAPNYAFAGGGSGGGQGMQVAVGALRIADGHAHVDVPKLKAKFDVDIATVDPADGKPSQIEAHAKGSYAGQPITAAFVGGALLSLREPGTSYPIDLHVANGPTRVALVGTVDDPLHFKGTALKLTFAGPDMSLLTPLTGVPIPRTPPFDVTGELTYADRKIRFEKFAGRLGRSDLEGSIAVDPARPGQREHVTALLASRRVDLQDLGGFIGATPGDAHERGETTAQRQDVARAEASNRLLPDTPVNVPKLNMANVHLEYRAGAIEGRRDPLDDLSVVLDVDDGAIRVHPVSVGIGSGHISGNFGITPGADDETKLHADVDFVRVSIAKLMSSAGFSGAGTIGGRAELDSTGRSVAQFLGRGNGEIKLFTSGGDLSAFLVALSGLQFGNALVSALGIPSHTELRCMVIDMPLHHGLLSTKTVLVDTEASNVTGSGTINLADEALDYKLTTEAKHFTIGSLPAPILITGTFKHPDIAPETAPLVERGVAAAVLGVIATPLAALIPTIQLGLGKDNNCASLVASAARPPEPAGAAHTTPHERRR